MKKIAFILALVMCFSLVLVACEETGNESDGYDFSFEDESEEAPVVDDESEEAPVVDDESEEAPVVDDESEEAPVEESEVVVAPPVEAGTENIALGKTYTHSGQYRMGGADVGWGWDDNAAISYPDEEDKTLTDGVIAPTEETYSDAVWAGFTSAQPDFADYTYITLDLGASTNVAKVVLHVFATVGDGISGPKAMEVYVSETEDFASAAKLGDVTGAYEGATGTLEVSGNATGRYIQLRITHDTNWIMVSEIEAYAAK